MKYLLLILIIGYNLYSQEFSDRMKRGIIEYTELDENSGMVVGIENPNIIWAINDGAANEIYGFDGNGRSKSILSFKKNLLQEDSDIEDIGIILINNVVYIVLSDIGDNIANRNSCYLYFIPEPKTNDLKSEVDINSNDIITIEFQYEDGSRDAECFFVDPLTNEMFIISKREKYARLYKIPLDFYSELLTAEFVLEFPFGNNSDMGFTGITAGDISKDGNRILIKDYNNIWYFERLDNESLFNTFSNTPIRIESYNYSLNDEPQGEAICWENGNNGFYTASEEKSITGFDASLFYFSEIVTSTKKKENKYFIDNNILYSNSSTSIDLIIYNYVGQLISRSIIKPFSYIDLSMFSNQAHYLILNNYTSIIKLR